MTDKYDSETRKYMSSAVEDLQRFMANSGRDVVEKSLIAWQAGYIAGIERAIQINNEQKVSQVEEDI